MVEQRTEEWHKQRIGKITASNVGAILGMAPYRTARDVLRAMVREYHGIESEFKGNVATEYGTFHEAGAITDYELRTGYTVTPAPFVVSEKLPWLGASPDGFVGDDLLLEIKCPYGKRDDVEPIFKTLKEEQPHYYAQIQVQLYCTGIDRCHFYQWSPRGDSLVSVNIDHEWLETNIAKLREFYELFLSEIDNKEHLEPIRKEVNTLDAKRLLEEYDQLSAAIDMATERKKEVLALLVETADGKNAEIWGRKLTQVEKEGAISYAKAIKKYAPDADLEPFRGKSSTYWRLT